MRLAIAALLLSACAVRPRPTPVPEAYCHPSQMMRAADDALYGVSDCYACIGARSCATEAGQWCCADSMCSECSPSPIRLDDERRKNSAVLHR